MILNEWTAFPAVEMGGETIPDPGGQAQSRAGERKMAGVGSLLWLESRLGAGY